MATVAKGILQKRWQPQLVLVRNKTKVNVTRPRLPHFERARMEKLCVPYFSLKKKETHIPNYDLCKPKEDIFSLHPLEKIIAKEALNWFNNSKIIGIFHVNSMSAEEKFNNQVMLKKNGFRYLVYGRRVMKGALEGTKFETILPLFASHCAIVVSPQPDIHGLVKISKKLHRLACMAAIVDNRLLDVTALEQLGIYKSIDEARAQLVSILQASSQNLVQNITHHSSNLVQLLLQYQEEKNK